MNNSSEARYLEQAAEINQTSLHLPGRVAWECPSNIALVKYWGKKPVQKPLNPSISMTLQHAKTSLSIEYTIDHDRNQVTLSYFFEDQPLPLFKDRYLQYLQHIARYMPFLNHAELVIRTRNTFPHSAGIASSASSFGALALAVCDMEHHLFGTLDDEREFTEKASFLARLGSGSACRSVYGGFSLWGRTESVAASDNEMATSLKSLVHPVFLDYCDCILVIHTGEKSVSSSAGHRLMEHHAYAAARVAQANENLENMLVALQEGDESGFAALVEEEALTLHAMMFTSRPGYILLKPNSLEVMHRIMHLRGSGGWPVSFSLDAGANVHLIYPARLTEQIRSFIGSELTPYCVEGLILSDRVGEGPVKIS
jgi:diphosphomevalonate decarboxylase